MTENEIYNDLASNLGVPGSERFLKILHAMFTPEEARICRELSKPATCKELAGRMDMDEKYLSKQLDKLVDRGMLTRGVTQYAFYSNLIGFHHDCLGDTAPHTGPYAIPQHVKDLWNDFFREEWSYMFLDLWEDMIRKGGQSLPIWPAIGALERSPKIRPEDLLPEENWRLIIENAKRRIIGPCGCRIVWGDCDSPLMACFAPFDKARGVYYLDKPGRLLKEVSLEETLNVVKEAEEAGLVHWGDCYCCDSCCENLFPVTRDKRFELMTPNRFLAVVDKELCKGCEICVDRCKFDAIEMQQDPDSKKKKLKAVIDAEKCKGCGLCIIKCKHNALTYEIVRPPEYLKPVPSPDEPLPPDLLFPDSQGWSTPSVSELPDGKGRKLVIWGHYDLK